MKVVAAPRFHRQRRRDEEVVWLRHDFHRQGHGDAEVGCGSATWVTAEGTETRRRMWLPHKGFTAEVEEMQRLCGYATIFTAKGTETRRRLWLRHKGFTMEGEETRREGFCLIMLNI